MSFIIKFLSFLFCLNFATNVFANVMIPSLMTIAGIFTVYSGFLVFVILFVKFLCFYIAIPNQGTRVAVAVLAMNLASATVGLVIKVLFIDITVGSILYAMSLDQVVNTISQSLTFGPLPGTDVMYGIIYYIGAVGINVIVEGFVAFLFFPNVSRWRILSATLIANVLGVAIGLIGLGYYRYTHGGNLPR